MFALLSLVRAAAIVVAITPLASLCEPPVPAKSLSPAQRLRERESAAVLAEVIKLLDKDNKPDVPMFMLVARVPGEHGLPGPMRLLTALWPDGVCLFARVWDRPGQDMQLGVVPPERILQLKEGLKDHGFMELPQHTTVDFQRVVYDIAFRDGKRAWWSGWNESLSPLSAMPKPDEQGRALVEHWFQARLTATLAYTQPSADLDSLPARFAQMRGFVCDGPQKTKWLGGNAWDPYLKP